MGRIKGVRAVEEGVTREGELKKGGRALGCVRQNIIIIIKKKTTM